MSIKLGIIGAGSNARSHMTAAQNIGVEIVAVADVDRKTVKRAADDFDIAHTSTDPKKLVALDDVDAVVVSVPNRFHAEMAILALNAGKDVLLEKPMALNRDECRQVNDAAKKAGRFVQIGFVNRYRGSSMTAKQLVDAGRLGDIYHIKANYYRRRGIPGLGGWFTTKAMSGGGPLIDLGVHIIDLALFVAGSPKPTRVSGKVYANFGSPMKDYIYESMWAGPPRYDGTFDVEDSAHALVRLEGGATMEINTTWAGNFPDGSLPSVMGFFGNKGGMTFELGGPTVRLATEENGMNVDVLPKFAETAPFDEQMRNFVRNVESRTEPVASGQVGETVQAILDAIYRSSEKDREVEIQ
jgi:predicted dehydrogenase